MTTIILQELINLLKIIKDEDYTRPSIVLSGATIGQHVRHSIEMYQCVLTGYTDAVVDYNKRKRDILIESSSTYAIQCLQHILLRSVLKDRQMVLLNDGKKHSSSFNREMLYCDEHTIHHMALIKVGINEIGGYTLSSSFGVAPSTIKYRQQCAQ